MTEVLKRYPDYGKSPPEYFGEMAMLFAGYAENIQARLADRHTGISRQCQFLPTQNQVIDLAEKFIGEEARDADFRQRFEGRVPITVRRPFDPKEMFWQLAAAFPDNPEYFIDRSFDELEDASKTLVRYGRDAAERRLLMPKTASEPDPLTNPMASEAA